MPVWFENDAPNTTSRSDSFMSQLATGVPLRPSTPAPSGWWSETWPLALNVVSTGAPSASASASDVVHVEAGAVTDDDHRPTGRRRSGRRASSSDVGGRRDLDGRRRGRGGTAAGTLGGRVHLHLVGQHQVGDLALDERVLERERHQLGVVRVGQHGLREPATSANAAVRSRSWNAPRPSTFDGT